MMDFPLFTVYAMGGLSIVQSIETIRFTESSFVKARSSTGRLPAVHHTAGVELLNSAKLIINAHKKRY